MINFFRKIRQRLLTENKFSKYLLYAIGEIVLVMIGILLALQVNNWNEERKEHSKIKKYAKSLILDLEADIVETKIRLGQVEEIIISLDSLTSYVRNKNINEISNLDVFILTRYLIYRPHQWNRSTIGELKSSGGLSYIQNDLLSKKIVEYDAITQHLEKDFESDKSYSEYATQQIAQVININYNYANQYQTHPVKLISIIDLKKMPVYKELQLAKLSLLTNDMDKFNIVINSLVPVNRNMKVRKNIEFSGLIKDAEELILLLKKEYHD